MTAWLLEIGENNLTLVFNKKKDVLFSIEKKMSGRRKDTDPLFRTPVTQKSPSIGLALTALIISCCVAGAYIGTTIHTYQRGNAVESINHQQSMDIQVLQAEITDMMISGANSTLITNGTCTLCASEGFNKDCPLSADLIPVSVYDSVFNGLTFRIIEVQPFGPYTINNGYFGMRSCTFNDLLHLGVNNVAGGIFVVDPTNIPSQIRAFRPDIMMSFNLPYVPIWSPLSGATLPSYTTTFNTVTLSNEFIFDTTFDGAGAAESLQVTMPFRILVGHFYSGSK